MLTLDRYREKQFQTRKSHFLITISIPFPSYDSYKCIIALKPTESMEKSKTKRNW